MTTTRLRRTTLNTATLQEVALHRIGWSATGAVANPYLPWDTPKAIKDAMVLYYDIAKQKATNESMAANPTLKDLSGNGNDATCYNFGWSGMSGIGGYITSKSHYEFTEDNYYLSIIGNPLDHMTFSFTVKGLVKGNKITIQSRDGNTYGQWTADGTYTIDSDKLDDSTIYIYNGINATLGNFTVDILPQYPNALVSDGVNDYCLVQDRYDDEGNLINKKSLVLNKEDGYTVIAKRKWLDETLTCGLTSKLDTGNHTNGAFGFELNNVADAKIISSWGATNHITLESNDITYGTSTKYNGTDIGAENHIDTDYLTIFKYSKETNYYGAFALYSLILFNRDLTDEEIQWVKNNLMQ